MATIGQRPVAHLREDDPRIAFAAVLVALVLMPGWSCWPGAAAMSRHACHLHTCTPAGGSARGSCCWRCRS
jgi:hypothetical protein